ncbi:MAG: hypothetical protein ACOX6L_09885 [Syntrophomonadaceae bacterium]
MQKITQYVTLSDSEESKAFCAPISSVELIILIVSTWVSASQEESLYRNADVCGLNDTCSKSARLSPQLGLQIVQNKQ